MTVQNVRSLLWRGEDLGSTGGGTRELIINTQAAAGARPQIASLGFVNSVNVGAFFGASQQAAITSLNRLVVNKSPDYWLTLTAQLANGGASTAITVPIPPLSTFFVPANMFGSAATLSINSAWPVPVPIAGTGASLVPQATAQSFMSADIVVEQ